MQSIGNSLKTYENKKTKISERAEVIKSIYELYSSDKQTELRRKENWKRYCKFCRKNKLSHSNENVALFKKQKEFIKKKTVKEVCILLSHIPTKDLYYVLSTAKDDFNRNKNIVLYFNVQNTQ